MPIPEPHTMTPPTLTQFRAEMQDNGLVHLVFNCPDRSMNVFSNKAIHELGELADWLHHADVKGVLVRCAGRGAPGFVRALTLPNSAWLTT